MTLDLNQYYRTKKDDIHSTIMEMACNLAAFRLTQEYDRPISFFTEIDPEGDGEATRYKPEFQRQFDALYDEEYNRTARAIKFDYSAEDGILKN